MRRVLDGYLMEKPERGVCLMLKSLTHNNLQLKAVLDGYLMQGNKSV